MDELIHQTHGSSVGLAKNLLGLNPKAKNKAKSFSVVLVIGCL